MQRITHRLMVSAVAASAVLAGVATVAPVASAAPAVTAGVRPAVRVHAQQLVRAAARAARPARVGGAARSLAPHTVPTAGDPFLVTTPNTATVSLGYTDLSTRATGSFSQPQNAGDGALVPEVSRAGTEIAYEYAQGTSDPNSFSTGISVFATGGTTVTHLTQHTDPLSAGAAVIDTDPTFDQSAGNVYFTRVTDDGTNAVVSADEIPIGGGTVTTLASVASNPVVDVDGNVDYLDQDPTHPCLVDRVGTTTCVASTAQIAAAIGPSISANTIGSQDMAPSLYSDELTLAVAYKSGTTFMTGIVTVIPGSSGTPTVTALSRTEVPSDTRAAYEPHLDAAGSQVLWTYANQLDNGSPTPGSSTVYATDTATGTHIAGIAGNAEYGDSSWFPPLTQPATSSYQALSAPVRVLDTRIGLGAPKAQLGAGRSVDVTVAAGGADGVPADATALVLNVTATRLSGASSSYVQVYPTPASGAVVPTVSNLNLVAAQTAANAVTVPVGSSGQVRLRNDLGSLDVLADVTGYYAPGVTAGLFTPLATPARALDTRNGTGGVPPMPLGAGGSVDLQVAGADGVPSNATAVVLNVGATALSTSTFVSAFPTPASGQATPTTSTINLAHAETRANLATVTLGAGGEVRFYNAVGSTNVFADIVGYYSSTGDAFVPLSPARIFDDRYGANTVNGVVGPIAAKGSQDARATGTMTTAFGSIVVPATAAAIQTNVTAILPTAITFVSLFATPSSGAVTPTFSTVNAATRTVVPNAAISTVGAAGQVRLYNAVGSTGVAIDLAGYFLPVS